MRIINIGLERTGKGMLHVPDVIRVMRKEGIGIKVWRVSPQGKSERTLIVVSSEGASREKIWSVAQSLGQDAIAVYDVDELKGDIVGPREEAWSPFDATYFQVY